MTWPSSTDYFEAVQLPASFSDPELRQGTVTATALGLPKACTGNFADVYQICCPNSQNWAVKCFTREIPGLQERYQLLSDHLMKTRFPFTVEFRYLAEGTRVQGHWFPMLKMRWVEGLTLNDFVRENADRSPRLQILLQMWIKLARQLRDAAIAHGDLQHGNVLLVPNADGKSVRLTLIDYDGMIVPALAQQPSGEVGHPAYQHPERLAKGFYNLDVDRFSHLVICCALQCVTVGGKALWQRHDNGDNLLFRKEDFANPGSSRLFRELWQLTDPSAHALVGTLILACEGPLAKVPMLDALFPNENSRPELSADQEAQVNALLAKPLPTPVVRVPIVRPPQMQRKSTKASRNAVAPRPVKVKPAPEFDEEPRRSSFRWWMTGGIVVVLILAALIVTINFRRRPIDMRQQQVNDLLTQADEAFGARSFDEAIAACDEALKIKPDDAWVRQKRQEYQREAQDEKKLYLLAIKKEVNLFVAKAEKALLDRRFNEAIAAYESAAKIDPTNAMVAAELEAARSAKTNEINRLIATAGQASDTKRFDDSIKAYESALKIDPSNTNVVSKLNDVRTARVKEFNGLVVKAEQAFGNQRFDEAHKAFEAALALNPQDRMIKLRTAEARAAARKQKDFNDLIARADQAYDNKQFDDAISRFEEALTVEPNNLKIAAKKSAAEKMKSYCLLITKGEQAHQKTRYDEAIAAFEAALKIDPNDSSVRTKLANARFDKANPPTIIPREEFAAVITKVANREVTYQKTKKGEKFGGDTTLFVARSATIAQGVPINKKTEPGDPIEGGLNNAIFQKPSINARITTENGLITRILVTTLKKKAAVESRSPRIVLAPNHGNLITEIYRRRAPIAIKNLL